MSSKDTARSKLQPFQLLLILFFTGCLIGICPFSRNLVITMGEHAIGRKLGDLTKWNQVIMHTLALFATFAAIWYGLWYTEQGKGIYTSLKDTVRQAFCARRAWKQLAVLFTLYVLCYLTVLRADYNYEDDLRRFISGHKSWVGTSRFVSEIAAVFLHTTFYISDISPFTQLYALAELAAASYILAYVITDGRITKRVLFAAVCLGISPFYVENLAYKFDSPYMAFAMLFGVMPFLFIKNIKAYAAASVISLLLVCASYQAANSVYIVLAIFMAFMFWQQQKPWKHIGIFAAVSIVCYLLSLLYFKYALMIDTFDSKDMHVTNGILQLILSNLSGYCTAVAETYGNLWMKFFTGLTFCLFPVSAAVSAKMQKRNPMAAAAFAAAVLMLMLLLSFGAYLAIGNVSFVHRAFMGFDALLAIAAVYNITALSAAPRLTYTAGLTLAGLFYGLFIHVAVTGNLFLKQAKYEDFRYTLLTGDLSRIIPADTTCSIYLHGVPGAAAAGYREYMNYGKNIGGKTAGWTSYLLQYKNMNFDFAAIESYDGALSEEEAAEYVKLPMLLDTYYHTIYGQGTKFYVELKNPQVKEYCID